MFTWEKKKKSLGKKKFSTKVLAPETRTLDGKAEAFVDKATENAFQKGH